MTKPFKETSRTIKHLTQRAEKGNFESSFQLYKNYSDGKNVEQKDEALAQKYYKEFEGSLTNQTLRIKSLQLSEFRRFRDLKINFDDKVTVIIGDNGAGKTSIAEALSKTFSWFNNSLEKSKVNGQPVNISDINVNSTDYAEITSKFKFDNQNLFEVSLARVIPGYTGSKSSHVDTIKKNGEMYRIATKNKAIMIPLLVFYSVERAHLKRAPTISETNSNEVVNNRFSALKNVSKASGTLENFVKSYIELVNLAEGESNTKEVVDLKNHIKTIENSIYAVYEGKAVPDNDPFTAKLSSLKKELNSLSKSSSSLRYKAHLEFVNSAIENLVPDVKNLEVDRSSGKPKLLVENFGNKVNISQLSQGQKMLVALTGDLAKRLVTLNPDAEQPLKCHGIVIIDEIELHLHPRWQQEILIGLQDTFSNIQFIVTTHSPQVLSTVDNKCIRKICLDNNGNPTIDTPDFQTKGVTSADILDRIMGTNSIPEKLEEAVWISKFYECLNAQNRTEADCYLSKIELHFGSRHPVVLDCQSQIRIAEMKIRLAKNK